MTNNVSLKWIELCFYLDKDKTKSKGKTKLFKGKIRKSLFYRVKLNFYNKFRIRLREKSKI